MPDPLIGIHTRRAHQSLNPIPQAECNYLLLSNTDLKLMKHVHWKFHSLSPAVQTFQKPMKDPREYIAQLRDESRHSAIQISEVLGFRMKYERQDPVLFGLSIPS